MGEREIPCFCGTRNMSDPALSLQIISGLTKARSLFSSSFRFLLSCFCPISLLFYFSFLFNEINRQRDEIKTFSPSAVADGTPEKKGKKKTRRERERERGLWFEWDAGTTPQAVPNFFSFLLFSLLMACQYHGPRSFDMCGCSPVWLSLYFLVLVSLYFKSDEWRKASRFSFSFSSFRWNRRKRWADGYWQFSK